MSEDKPEAAGVLNPARYAEVIVTLPVEGRFCYLIPENLRGQLRVGHRVAVPFGSRKTTGFVSAFTETPPSGIDKLRSIEARLDEEPLLTADLAAIVSFAADYYLHSAGGVLRVALPPGVTAASVQKARLTPKGRRAIVSGELDAADTAVLTRAARKGGSKKSAESAARLGRLVEAGFLRIEGNLSAKVMVEEEILVERIGTPPVLPKSAKIQEKILGALAGGSKSLDRLRSEVKASSFLLALTNLETRGIVRRISLPRPIAHGPPADRGGPLVSPAPSLVLTAEQEAALTQIVRAQESGEKSIFLLRGVTGSGKTEVYLRAIQRARELGRGAIVLVPEIALTSQLEARFRSYFSEQLAVLHSAMSDKERRRRWERIRSGAAPIALGPRSAVWAPVEHLGLVIVDEEHDSSFKQHNDLRYNGRDLALVRADRAAGICVLGSATPSLETRQMAKTGRLTELRLSHRVQNRPLPKVETVDLLDRGRRDKKEIPLISRVLGDALREVTARGEQTILFLNRRGFNTVMVCDECGEVRKCASCSVALTHHKAAAQLVCHYCGFREPRDRRCLACGEAALNPFGAGTERAVEAVKDEVADARVLRLDRDVTSKVGALEETLGCFRRREADVLVGTQMVAKGHDFPGVTLVGILCADASLAFPDFRAAERTFQLLTQVAGRAGRADRPGRVIVQTLQPDHYALAAALTHDDDGFFNQEIEHRRMQMYPPFSRLGVVRIESEDAVRCEEISKRVGQLARSAHSSEVLKVRGPAPAPIERIKNRWRRMVLVFAPSPARLQRVMRAIKDGLGKTPASVSVIFDVDAVDLL